MRSILFLVNWKIIFPSIGVLLQLLPGKNLLKQLQTPSQYGPYKVEKLELHLPGILDSTNPNAAVILPKPTSLDIGEITAKKTKFPLLIYAHGKYGGNFNTYAGHTALLRGMASFGFCVIAPRGCDVGCPTNGNYSENYLDVHNLIDWIQKNSIITTSNGSNNLKKSNHRILDSIDHSVGYGVFGHSMGAITTLMSVTKDATTAVTAGKKQQNLTSSSSSSSSLSSLRNIRAGVILHPAKWYDEKYGDLDQKMKVPLAVFTGTEDSCCGEDSARPIYDTVSAPKAYANMIGAWHREPVLFRTKWTAYVAAWFKIFLEGKNASDGNRFNYEYYHNLIYGNGSSSLCGGSIPMMKTCEALL